MLSSVIGLSVWERITLWFSSAPESWLNTGDDLEARGRPDQGSPHPGPQLDLLGQAAAARRHTSGTRQLDVRRDRVMPLVTGYRLWRNVRFLTSCNELRRLSRPRRGSPRGSQLLLNPTTSCWASDSAL